MSDITFKEKSEIFNPLSANPDKTVKHTQTIRQLLPMNCLSVRDHFVGLALRVNSFFGEESSLKPIKSVLPSQLTLPTEISLDN